MPRVKCQTAATGAGMTPSGPSGHLPLKRGGKSLRRGCYDTLSLRRAQGTPFDHFGHFDQLRERRLAARLWLARGWVDAIHPYGRAGRGLCGTLSLRRAQGTLFDHFDHFGRLSDQLRERQMTARGTRRPPKRPGASSPCQREVMNTRQTGARGAPRRSPVAAPAGVVTNVT